MHLRKSKLILIYFFLFIFVGSINNSELNKIKFEDIKYIKISGLDEVENNNLLKEIQKFNLENIFFLSQNKLNDIITINSLVEDFNIFKIYPSTLHIEIKKTNFLAKINDNGKIFLLGSNGKLTQSNFTNKELPFIFGKPNAQDFLKFKKIIDQSKFSYDKIKNFYFYPSQRWDIELDNKIIVKLSKERTKHSLNYAHEFLNNTNFVNLKIIDARVRDQIILND